MNSIQKKILLCSLITIPLCFCMDSQDFLNKKIEKQLAQYEQTFDEPLPEFPFDNADKYAYEFATKITKNNDNTLFLENYLKGYALYFSKNHTTSTNSQQLLTLATPPQKPTDKSGHKTSKKRKKNSKKKNQSVKQNTNDAYLDSEEFKQLCKKTKNQKQHTEITPKTPTPQQQDAWDRMDGMKLLYKEFNIRVFDREKLFQKLDAICLKEDTNILSGRLTGSCTWEYNCDEKYLELFTDDYAYNDL